jgi:hypothetical protein
MQMPTIRTNSPKHLKGYRLVVQFICLLLLMGCAAPLESTESLVPVTVEVDGQQIQIDVAAGTTVQFALEKAKVTLNDLDRVNPSSFTALEQPTTVKITRVREVFDTEESVIPFESQTVRNESLPDGQKRLIQAGVNGVQQITYRHVLENDVEISKTIFKTTVLTEAKPEIIMVGVQTPFSAMPLQGTLAYLTSGNAWVMKKTTGDRRAVVTTGDLDGRIFSMTADGQWLLYTRSDPAKKSDRINSLWAVNLEEPDPHPIDLKIDNVIFFADWVPGEGLSVMYSTVEPRETAPGWQANNDLKKVTISASGAVGKEAEILAANSGGIYGWWGTTFAFTAGGEHLAYARPDSVGLVDLQNGTFKSLIDLIPLQTRSDWAWVPSIGWSPDADMLYTESHVALSGLTSDEISPLFDISAVDIANPQTIDLIQQAGMFAYPVPSPYNIGERYKVAYLQAIFPEQSETSRYRLMLMDRDGSNRTTIFPPEGSSGMDPQQVVWGPMENDSQEASIALMYQGNLWLYNVSNGQAQQITGDGSIARVAWK